MYLIQTFIEPVAKMISYHLQIPNFIYWKETESLVNHNTLRISGHVFQNKLLLHNKKLKIPLHHAHTQTLTVTLHSTRTLTKSHSQ